MYQRALKYLRIFVKAFSPRFGRVFALLVKLNERIRIVAVLTFFIVFGWLLSQFVLAEKEMSVFVFPSVVTSDGWNNDTGALGQDLSGDAQLADFDRANSAYVSFGDSSPVASSTSDVSGTEAVSAEPSVVPVTESENLPEIILPIAPVSNDEVISEPTVQSENDGAASPESVLDPVEASPSFPNPFVPLIDVPTTPPPVPETENILQTFTSPQPSPWKGEGAGGVSGFNLSEKITRFFGVRLVLAHDTPSESHAHESPAVADQNVLSTQSVGESATSAGVSETTSVSPEVAPVETPVAPIGESQATRDENVLNTQRVGGTATTIVSETGSTSPVETPVTPMLDNSHEDENTATRAVSENASTTRATGEESESVQPEVTPMSDDPYTVASCTTQGLVCHIMTFDGFGLGNTFSGKPLLSATLEMSLAGRGDFGSDVHDRIMVRAYHGGRWEFLGETEVKGEFSNAKRGGYLSFDLPSVADWSDLSDLKIVVEYLHEGQAGANESASAYVDGIWINTKYSTDALTDTSSPEALALLAQNVRSGLSAKDTELRRVRRDTLDTTKGVISFSHSDEHADASIEVKTDRNVYHALGSASSYFNVTNNSDAPEVVRLQFHFPTPEGGAPASLGARVTKLSRYVHNVPHKVGSLKYDAVGYFCAGGWEVSASQFSCKDTREVRTCDALNADKTNCIENGARVGLVEDTEYRDGWMPAPLESGSFRDENGIFAQAIDFILGKLPKDAIPSGEEPTSFIADSILLQPGQTAYFNAELSMPLNGRGDFYVEAAAESGAYGLVHGAWDGSWNYRVPVLVDNDRVETEDAFAVPVSLADLPETFWTHVSPSGNDLRFVDAAGNIELPYWVASWNPETREGLAWVRIPKVMSGTLTRVYLYYGDHNAESLSDPIAPFRTEDPVPRAIIFGGSQHDITLHAIALGEDIYVKAGAHDDALLKKGESALFDGLSPGTEVLADGPVALSVQALGSNATVVPYGYAGMNFVVPGIGSVQGGGERTLAIGATRSGETHAEIRSGGATQLIDPISGSIVSSPIELSSSVRVDATRDVLLQLSSGDDFLTTPIYPSTNETLYGFTVGRSFAGFGTDGSKMIAVCSSGAQKEIDGRREGATTVLDICNSGGSALADSVRAHGMNNPVGVLDDLQGNLSGYLPLSEFANSYTLPIDAKAVAILCAPGNAEFSVGIYDPQGAQVMSTSCAARGSRPGKAYLSATNTFMLGSEIRSLDTLRTTFMASIVGAGSTGAVGTSPLATLYGAPLLRSSAPNHPAITFTEEEFVIPGEHRALDVALDGKEKKHIHKLLSKNREFSMRQLPGFTFQYTPQSNSFMQGVRDAFGVQAFTVSRVSLKHPTFGKVDVDYDLTYGEDNQWSVTLKNTTENLHPGKYTLLIEIEEGGTTYTDEYDFYWGVMAINYKKSVYTPGEQVDVSMGALSNNGNTICDARLKLWVVSPAGDEQEVPVSASGLCDGNNVVDVPDYSALFTIPNSVHATGTYKVKLVRFDEYDNVASQVTDELVVQESVPYEVERVGPTRIYPVAHYPMKIRVRAKQDFKGDLVERIPGDFVVIDRGNANLEWGDADHSYMTATWPVDMKAGDVVDLAYTFDAPDKSPYLYELGPFKMDGENSFTELRKWQIASDAAGKMMIYYDDDTYPIPAGWTCVSCSTSDPFYQRFAVGSTSYNGLGGGTATHTPTALAAVYATTTGGVGPATTNNTNNAGLAHSHTLTPQISGASNLPSYRSLRVLQSDSAGEPGNLPAGTIVAFDVASSSLPSGWYRYSALDGYYPYSASTSVATGGANTHNHTATGTTSVPPETGFRSNGGVSSASTFNHTHRLSTTTTDTVNNEPPYIEMLFARLPTATTTLSNYMITMWDNTPADGWQTLSGTGGALEGRFLKASTTYGTTGGSSASHTHADIIGATTTVTAGGNVYTAGATNQAPSTHYHTADVTGFSTDSSLPPYIDVIFAKRLSNIVLYEQNVYRWYNNINANTPTDPWPPGGSDLSENGAIDSSAQPVIPTNVLRLRMSLKTTNATMTPSTQGFKLQYVASTDCPNALNWTDVGAIGSGELWRGYNNAGVTDGALMSTVVLTGSNVAESYVEANNSPVNPATSTPAQYAEWDWVIQDNLAAASTNYCFRMVKSDGTPLDTYTDYPQAYTNTAPNAATLVTPYNNEKVSTTTPDFYFSAIDPETDDLDYEIQVDTNASFTAPTIDSDSTVNPELFDNIDTPANKAPFTQGETIHFIPTSALTNGTTYWWRVRAKDSNASNSWGAWSTARSFTVDTSVAISTWFQTTSSQFQTDTFNGANSSSSNSVMLNVGSTTGIIYGSAIAFSDHATGTVWGSFKISTTTPPGSLNVQLEYYTSTSSWALIPDADLAGNAAGFVASSTSLLGIDPDVYSTIRPRANLTDSSGTPVLLDWTITWGNKVNTPTLYTPFDNEKVATRTPTFVFMTTDPSGADLQYEISWSTSTSFTSSTTVNSATTSAGWTDVTNGADTSPYASGDRIQYKVQTAYAFASGTPYYWRVRARDINNSNVDSFWSDIRSLTPDTTVTVATWFQTSDGQFNTDTLTSMHEIGTTSISVATTTDEAMMAYGEGSVQTPRYRIWDGTTLGSELSALTVGAQIQWVILRASPLLGQYILGTLGTDRDVNYQVYENGAWGNQMELLTTAASVQRRSFDVAYESLSGRALAVSCDGATDAKYQIWDGSAWAATGTINLSFATNCEWVRMASNPINNELIALFRNTGTSYEAQVWNATTSTWGNSTTLGSMTEVADEGMAVEYEASSSEAVIVASNGNLSSFTWSRWSSTSTTWTVAATEALGDDFENGNLRRNIRNNDLVLCYVDQDVDLGVIRWNGVTNAWNARTEIETLGATKVGRPFDCQYKSAASAINHILIPYSDTVGTRHTSYDTTLFEGERSINTIPFTWTNQIVRTSATGTMLGLFFDHTAQDYLFAYTTGTSSWSSTQTVEDTSSVTASPYGEPFYMASKNPSTLGTVISSTITFSDGNAPAWDEVSWSSTQTGASTFKVQIQYYNTASSSWELVPDADIAGNSSGTSTSPISIRTLDINTYTQLRLVGNATCVSGNCPLLNDWTVKWAAGINVSGTAKQHDLTSIVTSGTVAVAVNGVLQTGKTGTINAGGQWSIANVTVFSGQIVEVWVSGGASSSRAIAIARSNGSGDLGGMSLSERWVTIGSASTTGQSFSLTDLSLYDYSNSGTNWGDIFFDVNGSGNYDHCAPSSGVCYDSSIRVLANNIFQPSTTTAKTINMYDMQLEGSLIADSNTMKVGGSWRNLGGFTSGAGTVLFNATTSVRTIDQTGAATSTFFNVTFGEAATQATWTFTTAFTATGTVAMNYGTTSPGALAMTLQGNLSIGASGTFLKGSATTTFSGSVAKTWTDSSAAKQDLGNVLIDGTAKTVTLGSDVKATNIAIGADDTLNAGGANTFTLYGFWDNNGTFTAQTGTTTFAATTTGKTINQGSSSFYNLYFNGVGGAWRWLNTNATTSNNLNIATGTVTLPGGTLAVGGDFNNTAGTFIHNSGVVKMTATASGKNIRAYTSPFFDLTFAGSSGGWSFLDTNATTSNTLTISAGTPIFPSGVLEVGNNFVNSGSFTANGGTLKMTSTLTARTITLGGSSLASLTVQNAGIFTITDTNATTTGDVTFNAGTTTLPTGVFVIGGSLLNSGIFTAGGNTVKFNAVSGSKTIDAGNSSFAYAIIDGVGGNFTISGNATTTNDFSLTNANAFTLASGKTLAIGNTFSNLVGGASTTWTGSTLALNSGTNYTINTKTLGGDLYGTFRLAANTQIRSWNSSSTIYALDASASLYSQDHNSVDGEVDIFGAYARTSGSDYWNYATDFDGTVLSGASRRAANVKFSSGATASFATGTTLEIVGTSTATTTIDRQLSGNYGVALSTATLNAQYYQFRNMDATGLYLNGSTTVSSLSYGDFSLDIIGGSSMTISSTTIDKNPAIQIFNVKFATSSGISSGSNITELGTPTSYWRFKLHYGNYAGEAYDTDPGPSGGNPGYIRWDDSNFVISIAGRVYSDAGAIPMGAPTCNDVALNVRVKVAGQGDYAAACASADGTFTVPGVTFSGDTVMTVYLDTAGGAQAALVTKSAAGDLSGINLYQHRVIVRHEDVTPMSIADMNAYDAGDDPDIPFTVNVGSPNTLTVNPDTEFWVWNAKTFVPSGNITLNSGGSGATYDGAFHVDNNAIFTAAGTEAHSVGGGFVVDAGGTFTAASSTFNFTATTSGKSIMGVTALTFWKNIFNGSGGNWVVNQSITVGENFTVNAGTVSGASNVTVNGTSTTGAGVIAMTGGTFTLSNGGTFGGNTDWAFNNLMLGNGTLATTTKTGSSTVTIGGVLTASTNQIFEAGTSTTWLITGGGTPLVFAGTFTVQNAIMRFAATSTANIPPATYAQLDFGAAGTSTPTYTLNAGTFTLGGALNVGTSTGALVTVNMNTNDPTITASGDVHVRASSTLIASNSGVFTMRRNFTNQGTTTASGGTITFDATTTGFSINPGTSSFANVVFNNTAGGWTIASNATATGAFTLTAANSFVVASSTTLEVNGVFTNSVGGSATTWNGSTLYLNSGAGETINTKALGADVYNTLSVGAGTHVRMWNSSATSSVVNASGSLYSQNHAAVSGSLYIYGAYTHSSGTDYWSYATDFDGTALGGSSRQANVRIATSSTLTFSGGGLEIVGGASASTTVAVQTAGAYAFAITGGSTTMQYFSLRNTDANGLSISGTPVVNAFSDGDFQLAVSGGTMVKVAGATIDANPLLTFVRDNFATSSGVTSGYNVTVTGVSASAWRFNPAYGNFAGEAYDNDPGGDPGYVTWSDSASQLTISGNVYADEGLTPIGAPVCDGVTQNVILKVQGAGAYTSACNAGTGAYSISSVTYNPLDTITVYLAAGSGAKAVNVAYDPATNISTMHLYKNRVIVRHEQGSAVGIAQMAQWDSSEDPNIPFTAMTSPSVTLSVATSTGLIVWNSKTFAPGGNVTVHANASGDSWDGTVHLYATSTWSSSDAQSHTIGGQFLADAAASVVPSTSTFTFTATTSGKTIAASTSLTFYNLTFNGVNGAWDMSGVATTSNDLTISNGTVTLPGGTLAVGSSFNNTGGTFVHNGGTIQFYSTATGKTVRANGSSFNNLLFAGSGGGWSFADTNATTTGSVTITAGTATLPTGIFAVGNNFDNQSGAISAPTASTLKMTSTSTDRILRFSGSWFANLNIAATGTFAFLDTNATTSGNVTFVYGTTTLPSGVFAIAGSFTNSSIVTATTGVVSFIATSSGRTINTGSSSLYSVQINGAGGGFTILANATTTSDFSILAASTFVETGSSTLAVGGTFTNLVGGSATNWASSTLALNSGTSYTLNTKTLGGDQYSVLRLAPGTNIRMWGSGATSTELDATASLYSQNHAAVAGSLYIYGNYTRTSGTDYWSYATDFDGAALGGSPRQANVRFAANATTTFSGGATLAMIGSASASTTVDRQSSGNYAITVDGGVWNAQYYQFRNMNATGLNLAGATTITTMNSGDFSLDVEGGSMMTIASTTIDQNASAQMFTVKFATSSGITSGYNVTLSGTTANAITFNSEYGNYANEAYDNDGVTGCGSIRFTDSTCLISDQRAYRWRNDDGAEGALATEWYNQSWTKRERVRITNNSTSTLTNSQVKMTVVYDSDMKSDFTDLRFTDSSGTTSIPYWVEASTTASQATVWVKVPTLTASAVTDIFMYFGNATGTSASDGASTFKFFDDFEDNNITEYSGDTTLFGNSTSFNYERGYGLAASAGNTGAQTTSGIAQASAGVGRDTTFRFFQYIDMSTGGSDEPCFMFAVQSPVTLHQNYGVCLSPFGADHLVIAKNVAYNGRNDGATQLATKAVTYSTGWYQVTVDWIATNNQLNVNVYDNTGTFFASTSASDSTYTSGGVGFSFWGQHGGWDIPHAYVYDFVTPTVAFGIKQADSGATWAAAENTYMPNVSPDQNIRLRISVRNSSLSTLDDNFRLQYAAKLAAPNCESVAGGNYVDVPVAASCGANAACMSTSAQFTNKASTTQLLSIPSGYTFTQAQILEDPSNQTDVVSVPANQFTEIEYNFQMNGNYASQDRYCFRTTNAGVALDNYTRVPEIQVVHPPVISGLSFNNNSNIALTEGTTTTIMATGTVTDLNGYADIVNASSTYYRSSISGGRFCAADNSNCYQIATTSCTFSSCSGNSCVISCSASMYYFADPTDAGSTYAADVWNAFVDVWDTSSSHSSGSANQELYTLSGLTTTSTIAYGTLDVGGDTGGANATTSINNTGNITLNLNLGGDDLRAGASMISYDRQKYATSTFTYSACPLCSILAASSSPAYVPLAVSKATTTIWSPYKDIYWGLGIPLGTAATTFSGSNVFGAAL